MDTTTRPPRCREIVEDLSSRADGEPMQYSSASVEAHVAGCLGCRQFEAGITAVGRRIRVRPAELVPDLTPLIIAGLPQQVSSPRFVGRRTRPPGGRARTASAPMSIIAATWAVVFGLCIGAVPHLLALDGVDPDQADRTLGIIECSLAVLLGHSAWRRRRPEGVLLFVICLAAVGTLASLADLARGSDGFGDRTHVVITLAAAAVLTRVPLSLAAGPITSSARAT